MPMSTNQSKINLRPAFWVAGLSFGALLFVLISEVVERGQILFDLALITSGVLLPLIWETSNKAGKRERFFLAIGIAVLVGMAFWMRFQVINIRVVGNSHGGLEDELREFNNAGIKVGPRTVQAELVYDWEALDTDHRQQKMTEFLERGRTHLFVPFFPSFPVTHWTELRVF